MKTYQGIALGAAAIAAAGITAGCGPGTGTGVSGAQPTITHSQAAPSQHASHAAKPKPAVKVVGTKTEIKFVVVGTGTPSIQYGSDSDTVNVPGGRGLLGDGVALPFRATMPFRDSAMYYNVTAQLETAGHVHATVTRLVITRYSDGSRKVARTLLAQGNASGNYAIADPQWEAGF